MNNYTQKVDKVGTDEVFPYPIKLEHDDEYIYLTVLRIPEPEELKLSPWVMNQLAKGHKISNYSSRLTLCIERDNPRKYGLNKRPPYRPYPESGVYDISRHPSKGGSFSMVNNNPNVTYSNTGEVIYNSNPQLIYNNIEVGNVYEFPIYYCTSRMAYMLYHCNQSYNANLTNIYFNARGTFRFNVSHPHIVPVSGAIAGTQEYDINNVYTPLYERTGIYSNTAKILLYPE